MVSLQQMRNMVQMQKCCLR
uniref:Uncharacterized protein n=1 Tax=Medicago truncatula TaxID=3880 RepID=I3T072_MEDTR|nr:unknown [Medicago truncatula]